MAKKNLKPWSKVEAQARKAGASDQELTQVAEEYMKVKYAEQSDDPAMQMSLPSQDPRNVLGYYQWADAPAAAGSPYSRVLEEPIRRSGFKPKYDVMPDTRFDPLAMGAKTSYWGATMPAGKRWSDFPTTGKQPGTAMNRMLREGELDEADRAELRYSDQTVYLNPMVAAQDRPATVSHEGTHRAVQALARRAGIKMTRKKDMLITRSLDYLHGSEDAKESAKAFLKELSPDGTIEGALKKSRPLIKKLQEAAINERQD